MVEVETTDAVTSAPSGAAGQGDPTSVPTHLLSGRPVMIAALVFAVALVGAMCC